MKTNQEKPEVRSRKPEGKGASRLPALLLCLLASVFCLLPAGCQKNEGEVLDVRTNPAGATIEVDGQRADGVSPMRLRVQPGEHLVVAAKGPTETRASVTVRAGVVTPLDLALRPLLGLVLIESFPSESEVLLDGASRGKTPLLLTDLPGGEHRFTLKRDGYETKDAVLAIADRQPKLLSLELKSLLTAIKVTSVPDKAKVHLDGSFVGESPQSIQNVLAGKHKVRLELEGYEPFEQEVEVKGKEEYVVNATLQEKYARIRIETEPKGGEIYLNNESRGKAPIALEKLHDGEYTIKVVMPNYPETVRKVTLKKGEDLQLVIPLERRVGVLQVITIPAGVDVFVDGEKRGTTIPLPNVQYSSPLFISDVLEGSRIVKLVKPGFAEVNTRVDIRQGQTTTFSNVQLRRLFIPDTEIATRDGRTLRGIVTRVDADGTVHFETAPGIFVDIPGDNIASRKPISK
ncbi:MAG: PEGA domain-containing protein [Verrucomicrobia bacterium]|nr:PEGA domain-containing protein [Verrucomicrobiota bacterium]